MADMEEDINDIFHESSSCLRQPIVFTERMIKIRIIWIIVRFIHDMCNVPPEVLESLTEFRQPIQVQSHLEMLGILVQLGRIQRT